MRVLIVEDEILVALEIQNVLEDLGYSVVGIAADSRRARAIAEMGIDVALVDVNLRDGMTGPGIGAELVERGATVLFMTANPAQLGAGVAGTLGVLPKPVEHHEVKQAAEYVAARHMGVSPPAPPSRMRSFEALH